MSSTPSLAGGHVALDALLIRACLRHEKDELHRLLGVDRLADAAEHPRKERVAE